MGRGSRAVWSVSRPSANAVTSGHVLVQMHIEVDEDGFYVGHAWPFNISSFGKTLDEAVSATMEATAAYLEALDDEGARDRVFGQLGVMFYPAEPPDDELEVEMTARPGEFVSSQRLSLVPA